MFEVRKFNPIAHEYSAIAELYNTVWPNEHHFSAEHYREHDAEWPAEFLKQRFVVESNGRIIAFGACYEKWWQHQPGTVHLEFDVHPNYESQHVERILYNTALNFLQNHTHQHDILATGAREDRPSRIDFLHEYGFKPLMRAPKSALDVQSFDFSQFQEVLQAVSAQGIQIFSLAELYQQEPDWKRKLYELRWAIVQDVPAIEPPTKPSMAEFEQMVLDDPALDPQAWFVAIDTNQSDHEGVGPFVGLSNLWLNDPDKFRLDTGLTGVLHKFRRRHIATALKVCTVRFAHQLGARSIVTFNEENNPMFQINMMLGFQPLPAWISYRKTLL